MAMLVLERITGVTFTPNVPGVVRTLCAIAMAIGFRLVTKLISLPNWMVAYAQHKRW